MESTSKDPHASDWLPIEWRDFYDVPRLFVVTLGEEAVVFESRFDDERDDYDDHYDAYVLPVTKVPPWPESWEQLTAQAKKVGRVPVKAVRFDASRRQSVSADLLAAVEIEQ